MSTSDSLSTIKTIFDFVGNKYKSSPNECLTLLLFLHQNPSIMTQANINDQVGLYVRMGTVLWYHLGQKWDDSILLPINKVLSFYKTPNPSLEPQWQGWAEMFRQSKNNPGKPK